MLWRNIEQARVKLNDRSLFRVDIQLPKYRVLCQNGDRGDEYYVIFEPIQPTLGHQELQHGQLAKSLQRSDDEKLAFTLPRETFILYPAENASSLRSTISGRVENDSSNSVDDWKLDDYSTSGIATMAQVRHWLTECETKHKHCKSHDWRRSQKREGSMPRPFVPTRLLLIGPIEEPYIKLIEPNENTFKDCFVTLSHCWGFRFKPPELVQENHQKLMSDGIEIRLLPQTFRDAIELARYINVKHIWIDCLCIKQGDAEEWKYEAARMHLVYGSAYCNLAAADSPNGTGGMFRKRDPAMVAPTAVFAKSYVITEGDYFVVRQDYWDHELLGHVLYSRGWVLQERLLSPRMLHFGRDQVFWQCPTASACEAFPQGLPRAVMGELFQDEQKRRQLFFDRMTWDRLTNQEFTNVPYVWKQIVEAYSKCDLTQPTDKLVALLGIVNVLKPMLYPKLDEEKFIAGLWKNWDLVEQLAWYTVKTKKSDGSFAKPYGRQQPSTTSSTDDFSVAPSWSWASIDGPVRLAEQRFETARTYRAELTIFDTTSATDNSTLKLRAVGEIFSIVLKSFQDNLDNGSGRLARQSEEMPHPRVFERSNVDPAWWLWRTHAGDSEARSVAGENQNNAHVDLSSKTTHHGTDDKPWCRVTLDDDKELTSILGITRYTYPMGSRQSDQEYMKVNFKDYSVMLLAYTSTDPTKGHASYSGHGIVLQPLEDKGHYNRCGFLEFRGLSSETFQKFRTSHPCDRHLEPQLNSVNTIILE